MLRIDDLIFDVREATLQGRLVDGRLLWSLSVETFPREIEGGEWQPHAYLDEFPAPSRSFQELFDAGWRIPSARDLSGGRLLPGQANCGLYVFEHDFLESSSIGFTPGDDRVDLVWRGRCSVHWSERYSANLEFFTHCPVDFLGFRVPAETERAARRLMKNVFDLNGLEYHREGARRGSFFIPPRRPET